MATFFARPAGPSVTASVTTYVNASVAAQVLGEDLVLVTGQQQRLQRGGDTWSNPVSYDKLAVRYRRWRNDVGKSVRPDATLYEGHAMSAGDLFSVDEGDFSPEVDFYVDQQ